MEAPSYLLPRPPFDLTTEKQDAFEDLFRSTPEGNYIDYCLPYPKWQFLSYLCMSREFVVHGSQNQNIQEVRPHQANDIRAFSNQRVIYATTDGIWVIFFSILDRKKYPEMSLFNSCLQARTANGQLTEPLYFFSITHSVLLQKPWCPGAVYIFPRQSFKQETSQQAQGVEIVFPHWISPQPTQLVAKLIVEPDDFPFLEKIHGHNDENLTHFASANPNDFEVLLKALES